MDDTRVSDLEDRVRILENTVKALMILVTSNDVHKSSTLSLAIEELRVHVQLKADINMDTVRQVQRCIWD